MAIPILATSELTAQAHSNPPRLPQLDGIRGLAISLVVFEHYVANAIVPGASGWSDWIKQNCTLGGMGVDLFFVLSGFLIGGILMDHRASGNYFKTFYLRRVCRIVPLYFLFLLAYVVFAAALKSRSGQPWFDSLFVSGVSLWTYATFTQTLFQTLKYGTAMVTAGWLTHTWSLAVEEQFYVILPPVVRCLRPVHLVFLCLAVMAGHWVLFLYLWLFHPATYYVAILLLPLKVDALPLGTLCAWLVRKQAAALWLAGHRHVLYGVLGVLAAGACWFAPKFNASLWELERDLLFCPWMNFLFASILLLAVTEPDGLVARVARFPVLCRLGFLAYGTFLFHQPVNGLMHGLILGRGTAVEHFADGMVTGGALAVTLVMAAATWHFFEKPIIAWSHSCTYREPDAAAK